MIFKIIKFQKFHILLCSGDNMWCNNRSTFSCWYFYFLITSEEIHPDMKGSYTSYSVKKAKPTSRQRDWSKVSYPLIIILIFQSHPSLSFYYKNHFHYPQQNFSVFDLLLLSLQFNEFITPPKSLRPYSII